METNYGLGQKCNTIQDIWENQSKIHTPLIYLVGEAGITKAHKSMTLTLFVWVSEHITTLKKLKN